MSAETALILLALAECDIAGYFSALAEEENRKKATLYFYFDDSPFTSEIAIASPEKPPFEPILTSSDPGNTLLKAGTYRIGYKAQGLSGKWYGWYERTSCTFEQGRKYDITLRYVKPDSDAYLDTSDGVIEVTERPQ